MSKTSTLASTGRMVQPEEAQGPLADSLRRATQGRSASLAARHRRSAAGSFGAALWDWVAERCADPTACLAGVDAELLRSGGLRASGIGAATLAAVCRRARLDPVEFMALVARDSEEELKERIGRRSFADRTKLVNTTRELHDMLQRLQDLLRPPTPPAPAAVSRFQFAPELLALRRWAEGHVPAGFDVEILVHDTLRAAMSHGLDETRGAGARLAYLRRILMNMVRDQLRSGAGKERFVSFSTTTAPSSAGGGEGLESYRKALARLPERLQRAVVLRLEHGASYEAIANSLGFPSADAARLAVARSIVRLAKEMES